MYNNYIYSIVDVLLNEGHICSHANLVNLIHFGDNRLDSFMSLRA